MGAPSGDWAGSRGATPAGRDPLAVQAPAEHVIQAGFECHPPATDRGDQVRAWGRTWARLRRMRSTVVSDVRCAGREVDRENLGSSQKSPSGRLGQRSAIRVPFKNPSGVQGGLWQSRILQKPRVQLVIYEMQNNVKSRFSYEQLFYYSNVLCDSDSMQYVCRHMHIVVPSKTSSSANDQNLNQPLKVHLSFFRGPRDDI